MSYPRSNEVLTGIPDQVASAVEAVRSAVEWAGFWAAILLPAFYVPLMVVGHPLMVNLVNLATAIGLHVALLLVGQGHADHADHPW